VDGTVSGTVRVADQQVELAAVTAGYLRPYDSWRVNPVARAGKDSPEARHATGFGELLWLWAELSPAMMVNRPSAMASNGSKPRQALTIAAHGFAVPETLISTDADAVIEFGERHEAVVYKSISGIRSIVSRLDLADRDRLADLSSCPTQFQQHVPGVDYRVHVVGDQVFCSRIESVADDYRYSSRQGLPVSVQPATLPGDWPDRCRALSAELDFLLAGIDLRCTPDGVWYCFEVNPSPAFSFYDRRGLGIGRAVSRLLAESVAA
jgi:glutathione synthase/RimK-type ligase-like ATP-grasp enzyme